MSDSPPVADQKSEATTGKRKPTPTEIATRLADHVRPLFAPGQVIELRALECRGSGRPHTEAGFFDTDHLVELVKAALDFSGRSKGVYFTINPLKPALINRRSNRVEYANEGEQAKDKHVVARQWLLIDVDPVRDSYISASSEEKESARELVEAVRVFLHQLEWPDPILADSGNGYHLYYRIDLPADDGGLVERCLKRLAERFDTPEAKIDRSVFNPARISKFPGTLARKGDNTKERPHRRAEILELPGTPRTALDVPVVARELLERLGGSEPIAESKSKKPSSTAKSSGRSATAGANQFSRLKVEEWLAARKVDFRVKPGADDLGRIIYVLKTCPFDESHADPDACIMQSQEAKMSAKCFHDGCSGNGWQEFKRALGEPDGHHYDPPLAQKKSKPSKQVPSTAADDGDAAAPPDSHDGEGEASPRQMPTIQGNKRQLPDVTDEAIEALLMANDPPQLFQRGGVLTRIRPACDEDPPLLEPLTDHALRGCMARVAKWVRVRDTDDGEVIEDAAPPMDAVKDLATLSRWEGVPPLRQLIESPVFDRHGRLVATPGYHRESRLWYEPSAELRLPPVESFLESGSVSWAREFLVEELLGDFPFADDASRSHAIAALLLPFVRPLIDGPTPLHLFDAPVEGTGKTLLATVISLIATGRVVEPVAEATCDEEWRKRITAVLAEGPPIVLLDNLNRVLDSGSLASVLTSQRWKDRILGVSKTARLPNTALWLASGNNTRLSRELIRRTAFCRIDAKVDVPWERQRFRHPNLVRWVKQNRSRLVQAALILCHSWIVAGRKPGSGKMGMFEGWVETVGGILEHADVPGFLGNAAQFRAQRADQASEWRAFVKAWWERHADRPVGVVELYALVVQGQLLDSELGDKGEKSQRIRLGKALARCSDRIFGDYRLVATDPDHKACQRYRLESVRETVAARSET